MVNIMDIGDRFRKLREINKLNQREFALRIGINQSSLSDIERGQTKPSIETVIATSKNFGVSTDWLLFGTSKEVSNEEIVELINLYMNLPLEDQIDFLDFLRIRVKRL